MINTILILLKIKETLECFKDSENIIHFYIPVLLSGLITFGAIKFTSLLEEKQLIKREIYQSLYYIFNKTIINTEDVIKITEKPLYLKSPEDLRFNISKFIDDMVHFRKMLSFNPDEKFFINFYYDVIDKELNIKNRNEDEKNEILKLLSRIFSTYSTSLLELVLFNEIIGGEFNILFNITLTKYQGLDTKGINFYAHFVSVVNCDYSTLWLTRESKVLYNERIFIKKVLERKI